MTTANPCSSYSIPAPRIDALHPMEAAREYLIGLWRAWRERQLERARWRTLDELSDATRRDLGLAERGLDGPAARSLGWERGPWL